MDQAKLINLYLGQGEVYHSDSKGDMILIASMHPDHAANAARVMLRDSGHWALDAKATVKNSALWMINRPLWIALILKARS